MKGPSGAYVVAAFASWIWELGHTRVIIQSDGQPAILALVAVVRDKVIADGRTKQVVCQIPPKGSHESDGAAERTVQQVRGMARVCLEHVRDLTGSSELSMVVVGVASRSADVQHISCACGHADNTAFKKSGSGEMTLARRRAAHLKKVRRHLCAVAVWVGTHTLTNTS